jgi:cytochrome c5
MGRGVRMKVFAATALVGLLGTAAAPREKPDPRDAGPNEIDVSGYPAQQQRNYDVFSSKCAKCHPLARSINSRFAAAEWKRYIDRMARSPSAGISAPQADSIYEFLRYYSGRRESKPAGGGR